MKKIYMLFLTVFVFSCFIMGCGDDPIPGIYDPNDKGATPPSISSITPEGVAYAVSDELIIRGQNFSPIAADNFVYFNTTKVEVLSASATELKVMTPNVLGDSVKIKVAVMGAQLFSNIKIYKVLPTFIDLGSYGPVDAFYAIETDVNGNLYVNIEAGTTGRIDKITPAGVTTPYATIPFGVARSMKFGPDGSLYVARNAPIIARVPPNGGASVNLAALPNGESGSDLDFDKDGNMWVVGTNSTAANRRVVKMRNNAVVTSYIFNAQLRVCRVFNNYLYVAGQDGTDNNNLKIWRAAIDGNGDLGAFEVYYNWYSSYSSTIYAITFAADGTLYAANDGTPTVVSISPNKVVAPLYPANLARMTYNFIWGTGEKYVYLTKRIGASGGDANNKIMKVYMAKDGAPYFGRN